VWLALRLNVPTPYQKLVAGSNAREIYLNKQAEKKEAKMSKLAAGGSAQDVSAAVQEINPSIEQAEPLPPPPPGILSTNGVQPLDELTRRASPDEAAAASTPTDVGDDATYYAVIMPNEAAVPKEAAAVPKEAAPPIEAPAAVAPTPSSPVVPPIEPLAPPAAMSPTSLVQKIGGMFSSRPFGNTPQAGAPAAEAGANQIV